MGCDEKKWSKNIWRKKKEGWEKGKEVEEKKYDGIEGKK